MHRKTKFKKIILHVPNPENLDKYKQKFLEPDHQTDDNVQTVNAIYPYKLVTDQLDSMSKQLFSMVTRELNNPNEIIESHRDQLFLEINRQATILQKMVDKYRDIHIPLK